MQPILITNESEWTAFHKQQDPQLFVQSWQYGNFIKNYGDEAFFVGIKDENNQIIAGSLVAIVNAKRGRFYYLPYGPICANKEIRKDTFSLIHEFLKNKAKADNVNFIRCCPFWADNKENQAIFQSASYRPAPIHMLAETTWILALDKPPTELLKNMRQNHRNLIRRSEKDGITIRRSHNKDDLKIVDNLLNVTAKRHQFIPFSLKYLEAEFTAFAPKNATIYLAEYQGEIIAASVIFFYGDSVIYRHGASLSTEPYRKLPATYAIQWAAINDAYSQGFKYYNFWGIAPEGATKHPYYGITTFKKGFGGFQKDIIHAQDYPLNFKYWINFIVETMRRLKRGF